ncbi:uncharacterized protein M437DRAFT_59426 [Aureobasidium melanogenum CBS 110374]|uniref:Uncharacterized protein n=1 Tax=Aureobasidium melanogenum (strain CBS 110374) TaxID=1043003 RepID=A0A074VCC3_AURM1|nr:uncharacterized protein M437DRAFT_59426 [Aureobasidium melanogenum CBS 110374]KEQ58350.1 hypothetical protein M437DRAFT_59426 [Aureobasidium melanogenum CBS 110374]
MSPILGTQPFQVTGLQNLSIGRALPHVPTGHDGSTIVKGTGWSLPSGAYTARQIVEGCAPLLETVLHHLSPSPPNQPSAREMLLDNLASNLALGTRESSLEVSAKDASRKEFAAQAVKIGKTLVTYARETKDVSFDPDYAIRSPCEGHLLKPAVTLLMFGPRSLGHLMQMYNEYLHQMVLLRDALLPFDNYEEVVIPITAGEGKQRLGMRFTESNRMSFIAELMTKLTTQKAVVRSAQSLLARDLAADNAYGFQYRYGVILPAAVVGGQSLRLLRYIPAIIDDATPEVSFEYEFADYYTTPRIDVPQPSQSSNSDATQHGLTDCSFAIDGRTDSKSTTRILHLQKSYANGNCSTIDVGQISRGWRYSYKASAQSSKSASKKVVASVHSAADFLASFGSTGLITDKEGGVHLIQCSNNLELLACLGAIYPDNIIVLDEGATLADTEGVGQSLPGEPRFILQIT